MEISNTITYAFYFTLQDLSFFIAVAVLNPTYNVAANEIICFSLGVIFCLLILIYLWYSFYVINFKDEEKKLYNYKHFFLLAIDYDLFPTYNLTEIPTTAKQIHRYSNLRIFDMIKKIIYSFLIVHFLNSGRNYT